MTDLSWLQIESEARAQVRAELDREMVTPLQPGATVAWALTRFGHTDGLSAVHRVGDPLGDQPTTLCGDLVPDPILRVPLSPRLIRTLGNCKYCESVHALKAFAA